MHNPDGWGIRFQPLINIHNIWFGLGLEVLWWRSIPSLFAFELFGWEEREFHLVEKDVLTLVRIKFLYLDLEFFITGGKREI